MDQLLTASPSRRKKVLNEARMRQNVNQRG